jgi:signal transduction histidine kinase
LERSSEASTQEIVTLRPPRAWLGLRDERTLVRRIAVAILAVALGLALRLPLWSTLGRDVPFATFYPAIVLAAWYGGFSSGLLSTGLSSILVAAVVLPTHPPFGPRSADGFGFVMFVVASIGICLLQDALHRSSRATAVYAGRLARLQSFAAALADAATAAEVATAAVREGIAAAGAIGARLRLVDLERRTLRDVAQEGHVEAARDADALQALELDSLRDLSPRWTGAPDGRSIAMLPLAVESRALGVLELVFAESRGFEASEREFLLTIARQCGHALDRARLFEGEHHANARLAVLAEIGRVLGGALSLDGIPQAVAHVLVPGAADAAMVEVYDDAGSCVAGALVHVDPRVQGQLRAESRSPAEPPLLRELVVDRGPRRYSDARFAEPSSSLLARVGATRGSVLVVPVVVGESLSGAIAMFGLRASRRYGDDDLTLAEEVAARASIAVEQARLHAELQAAIRVRDDFLSVASHELNTPLTPLKMHLGALRRGHFDPAKTEERLAALDRQVDRLAQLVAQLLDVSRITAGRLRLEHEPVDLAAVVRDTVQRMEGPLAASGSELRLYVPQQLVGMWDPLRLDQIATNLITNAIKYGEGRPIDVSLDLARAGMARLSVRDHGIGIAPEHLDRIFGRFERAVSVRHFGGFGLGLWIVRQVVEGFGGTIHVESEPAQGATFTIELPRGEVAPAA